MLRQSSTPVHADAGKLPELAELNVPDPGRVGLGPAGRLDRVWPDAGPDGIAWWPQVAVRIRP